MKNIIVFAVLFISSLAINAQPTITFPMNNAVFQRNGNSSGSTASVTFLGQTTEGSTPGSFDSEYWITKLDKYGSSLGYHVSPTGFYGKRTQIGTSRSYTYRIETSIPTGWYQFSVKNGSNNAVTSIKFGVGEVFVVAGQSNAQGFGTAYHPSTYDNNESVLSLKTHFQYLEGADFYSPMDVGGMNMVNSIPRPVFGRLTAADPKIGPMGNRPWYYNKLGELISNMHGDNPIVPVMFYNVALSRSTITNWHGAMKTTEKMFNFNYSNPINWSNTLGYPDHNASAGTGTKYYPNSTGWHIGSAPSQVYERLFTLMKNVLSFYGNIFGVRAILWHQGESETKTLLTQQLGVGTFLGEGIVPTGYNINTYSTKLEEIIDETRQILPGLGWGMSKVSLTSEKRISDSKQLYNIINPANQVLSSPAISGHALSSVLMPGSVLAQQSGLINSYVKWFTQNSDTITYYGASSSRQNNDFVHFNTLGLNKMADDANANRANFLTLTPVLNTPPPYITVTYSSGSNYNVTISAPSGISYVDKRWNYMDGLGSFIGYDQSVSNNTSNFTGLGSGGYVKDTYGRIHIIPAAYFGYLTGYRVASNQVSRVFPNPIEESSMARFYLNSEQFKKVKFDIFSENSLLIHSETKEFDKLGQNEYIMPYDKIKSEKIVYLHIIKSETSVERIRLLIN